MGVRWYECGGGEGDECCVGVRWYICGKDEGVNGAWGRGGEIQTFKPCPWRTTRMTTASSLTLRPMQMELCVCGCVRACNVHTL